MLFDIFLRWNYQTEMLKTIHCYLRATLGIFVGMLGFASLFDSKVSVFIPALLFCVWSFQTVRNSIFIKTGKTATPMMEFAISLIIFSWFIMAFQIASARDNEQALKTKEAKAIQVEKEKEEESLRNKEAISRLAENKPKMLAQINQAIKDGDFRKVKRLAGELKPLNDENIEKLAQLAEKQIPKEEELGRPKTGVQQKAHDRIVAGEMISANPEDKMADCSSIKETYDFRSSDADRICKAFSRSIIDSVPIWKVDLALKVVSILKHAGSRTEPFENAHWLGMVLRFRGDTTNKSRTKEDLDWLVKLYNHSDGGISFKDVAMFLRDVDSLSKTMTSEGMAKMLLVNWRVRQDSGEFETKK